MLKIQYAGRLYLSLAISSHSTFEVCAAVYEIAKKSLKPVLSK